MLQDCRQVQSMLDAFLDGELPNEQILSIEIHLSECPRCNDAHLFAQAVQFSTKEIVEEEPVSDAFEQRLRMALAAERARVLPEVPTPIKRWDKPMVWALAPALAAAAGVFVWLTQTSPPPRVATGSSSELPRLAVASPVQAASLAASDGSESNAESTDNSLVNQALDYLIDYHSAPPPPQVVEQDLVETFESDVGVRVEPPNLSRFGAFWESASIVPVQNHQAAQMRYRLPDHHVTVYVYDPRKVPVHQQLDRRVEGEQPVYVGNWRGYGVAATQRHGVGYALASDLDDLENAELLSDIH